MKRRLTILIASVLIASYIFGLASGFISNSPDYVEAYFCPEDKCSEKLISLIDESKKSIDIAILIFTHGNISDALIRAHERGVKVRVLFDRGWATSVISIDEILTRQGIATKYYVGREEMHNKFMIVDDRIVATGSFDYDRISDTANDENILIIRSPREAKQYKQKFLELFESGTFSG